MNKWKLRTILDYVTTLSKDSVVEIVPCHYHGVHIDKKRAEERKKEFVQLLKSYPNQDGLKDGLTWIELKREFGGDRKAALRFLALGKVLGLWELYTPEKIGVTGEVARAMANDGYIMAGEFAVTEPVSSVL